MNGHTHNFVENGRLKHPCGRCIKSIFYDCKCGTEDTTHAPCTCKGIVGFKTRNGGSRRK